MAAGAEPEATAIEAPSAASSSTNLRISGYTCVAARASSR